MLTGLHLRSSDVVSLHEAYTVTWHLSGPALPASLAGLDRLVVDQHMANFELWHAEDAARTPGASDTEVARIKRSIDLTNQRRNDLAEQCDRLLLDLLASSSLPDPAAELNSESPGLMIDRLSILALKLFHTREEAARPDAPLGHAERNRQRFSILAEQRDDLAGSLDRLWQQVLAGQRRFKLYQQLKMYNDPELNPVVYAAEFPPP